MRTLLQDLRHATRSFSKTPGFTLLAIAVLTVGIGVNSAAFSIVNVLFLRPLGADTGDLVGIHSHDHARPGSYRPFSYPNYADVRDSGIFDGVLAQAFTTVYIPAGETMRRTVAGFVSAGYFDTLGVRVAAGRPFTTAEERPGSRVTVAIATHEAWNAAGRHKNFVGSTIRVNGRDLTIVGVAPEGFTGTLAIASPEVWLPLGMFDAIAADGPAGPTLADRRRPALALAGRLRSGASRAAVESRLAMLSREMERAYPAENRNQVLSIAPVARLTPGIEPGSDSELTPVAALVLTLSGIVLVVACLNLANLLLARNASRTREIALRLALGASRGRIVRQLVTESLLLALVACGGGLLLAYWAMLAFSASLSSVLPAAMSGSVLPDLNVVGATLAFAIVSTVLAGTGPAWQASRRDLVASLKREIGGGARRRFAARNLLVAAQIALSLALVAAAALFARATIAAAAADPGFGYDGALVATVDAGLGGLDEEAGRATFREIVNRVRAVPGVRAAALASTVPFGPEHESREVGSLRPDGQPRRATYRVIGAGYFEALRLPLLRGREFTRMEEESAAAPAVAVIDELLARTLFDDGGALGESIRLEAPAAPGASRAPLVLQIVGIVAAVREDVTSRDPVPHVYVPFGRDYRGAMHLHVKGGEAATDAAVLQAVGSEIRAAAPRVPLLALATLRALHERSLPLFVLKTGGAVLALLGILALVLAMAGIYGLRSYLVSTRSRELCIRMAVGARAADVLWLVLRDGLVLTGAGLAFGLPLALVTSRVLNSVMWGFTSFDPVALLLAPALLGCTALVASYVPARRAARLEPMTVLRGD